MKKKILIISIIIVLLIAIVGIKYSKEFNAYKDTIHSLEINNIDMSTIEYDD